MFISSDVIIVYLKLTVGILWLDYLFHRCETYAVRIFDHLLHSFFPWTSNQLLIIH